MKAYLTAIFASSVLFSSCASNMVPKERHVVMHTKARIERHSISSGKPYYTLEIDSRESDRSIFFPTNSAALPSLAKNRSYTVELLEKKIMLRGRDGPSFWFTELLRISDESQCLYDASVCQVHGIKMERSVVPILYGLFRYDRKYDEAMRSDFPNTGKVFGGCCVDSEQTLTRAWICPTCLAQKKQWNARNIAKRED